MSAVPQKSTEKRSAKPTKSETSFTDSVSEMLNERSSDELVLGFAGPVGCGIQLAVTEAETALSSLGYTVHIIKLSQFIEEAISKNQITVDAKQDKQSDSVYRIIKLQDGGNALRKTAQSKLAELSIRQIAVLRNERRISEDQNVSIREYIPPRTAYLLNQIKHPDEVALLRQVYGQLFHLIGVISVAEKRKARLISTLKVRADETSMLMERDRKEEERHGQQLDKALQMADFFVSTDRSTTPPIQRKLRRFFGLLHGENGITPSSQEYGMYAAYSAGLKSACLSRQVGAAITNVHGKVVSTGCNDVPKAMGGLYTSEDGEGDLRCVHREEQVCFNDREKNSHKSDIRSVLGKLHRLDKSGNVTTERLIPDEQMDTVLEEVFKASHIEDLTEFSRAVHAEMDAIISLARSGTAGLVGASLYTTTFPCHSCARHIVAAGITKVYYIEPYEKSLAQKLHADAIAFETEDDDTAKSPDVTPLVRFIHFEGVSPRQYLNLFVMTKRKDVGRVIKIIPKDARKTVVQYLDSYIDFESKVVERLKKLEEAAKPAEIGPPLPDANQLPSN